MKNIIIEMKNTLDGINSRLNYTEEWISELDKNGNHWSWTGKKKKGIKRNEDCLRDLWDSINCTNICIIGILDGE